MYQYQDNHRLGHLDDLYHIFSYLNSHIKMGRIGYDQMDLNVDFLVLIIMRIGRNFTGTLRMSYRQIFRSQVVWL